MAMKINLIQFMYKCLNCLIFWIWISVLYYIFLMLDGSVHVVEKPDEGKLLYPDPVLLQPGCRSCGAKTCGKGLELEQETGVQWSKRMCSACVVFVTRPDLVLNYIIAGLDEKHQWTINDPYDWLLEPYWIATSPLELLVKINGQRRYGNGKRKFHTVIISCANRECVVRFGCTTGLKICPKCTRETAKAHRQPPTYALTSPNLALQRWKWVREKVQRHGGVGVVTQLSPDVDCLVRQHFPSCLSQIIMGYLGNETRYYGFGEHHTDDDAVPYDIIYSAVDELQIN